MTSILRKPSQGGQFKSPVLSIRRGALQLGVTPKQRSTGGKQRLGGISRQGNERLRQLSVVGAMAVIRQAKPGSKTASPRLLQLLERRPRKLAAVALANKMARTAWAMMTSGEAWRMPKASSIGCPARGCRGAKRADRKEMVIGRSDEQQSPSDSLAFITPRECLALLGGTHLGQRSSAAQRGRTHDRNRTDHQKLLEAQPCIQEAVHTRVGALFSRRNTGVAQDGGDLADAGVSGGDVEQLALALIEGKALRLDLQGELGDLEPRERRRVAIGRRFQHGGSL